MEYRIKFEEAMKNTPYESLSLTSDIGIGFVKGIDYLSKSQQERIKELEEGLAEMRIKAMELMDHCLENKYLSDEDETDGQIEFNETCSKSLELLTKNKK